MLLTASRKTIIISTISIVIKYLQRKEIMKTKRFHKDDSCKIVCFRAMKNRHVIKRNESKQTLDLS